MTHVTLDALPCPCPPRRALPAARRWAPCIAVAPLVCLACLACSGSGGASPDGGPDGATDAVARDTLAVDTVAPTPRVWVPVPIDGSESISRVSAYGPTGLWALGSEALLHFDGKAWVTFAMPGANLVDVWASSMNDAWAIAQYAGRALHWDGKDWTVHTDFPVTSVYCVTGSSPTNVWVGSQWNFNTSAVRRYDGTSWTTLSIGTQDSVRSIWTGGATDAWAVSTDTARHWDGQTWTSTSLSGVASIWSTGASGVTWAVGKAGLLARFDGAAWQPVAGVTTEDLASIWGSGPSDVWAVGAQQVLHFDGNAWSSVAGAQGAPAGGFRVTGTSATNVWILATGNALYNLRPAP